MKSTDAHYQQKPCNPESSLDSPTVPEYSHTIKTTGKQEPDTMTHFERCDERLQTAITRTADKLCNELCNLIFNHLDSHSGRFQIDGEDAGALAKVAVDSIYEKVKEALAK